MPTALRRISYLLLGLLGFKSLPAEAQVSTFLCYGTSGIKGEAQAKVATDCSEVTAWSWGTFNSSTIGSVSGGGGAGKADFQSLTITKIIDTASPELEKRLFNGDSIDEIELKVLQTCNTQLCTDPTFRIAGKLVLVTTVQASASDGDEAIFESISLELGAVQRCYRRQNPDGSFAPEVCATWSRVLNLPVFSVDPLP